MIGNSALEAIVILLIIVFIFISIIIKLRNNGKKKKTNNKKSNKKAHAAANVPSTYDKLAQAFEKLFSMYCYNVTSKVEKELICITGILNKISLEGIETPDKPMIATFACNHLEGTNFSCGISVAIGKKPNVASDEFKNKLLFICETFDVFGLNHLETSGDNIIFGKFFDCNLSEEKVVEKIDHELSAIRAVLMLDSVKEFIEQILI